MVNMGRPLRMVDAKNSNAWLPDLHSAAHLVTA